MKFISLFAGVGGFDLALERLGHECVYANDIDKYCKIVYDKNFMHKFNTKTQDDNVRNLPDSSISDGNGGRPHTYDYKSNGLDNRDITTVKTDEIPNHELLVGGFPCQSFSVAGKRRGFDDTRGTLFFEIARILREKKPRLLLLENVKGLLSHDNGSTFKTIIATLDELGYDLQWQVLNSKNFGVPQNRERVFIIGNRKGTRRPRVFPVELPHDYSNTIIEKVYLLSKELSQKYGKLLPQLSQSKEGLLPREQMQTMLSEVSKGVQKGECREVQSEAEGVDSNTKGSIQVVKELNSWTSSQDRSGKVYGVVQIPTEEVLLLWSGGGDASISFRQVQQQDLSFERGQDRLIQALRGAESSSLLFAVQSHQGRLLYSIGNGRDWQKLYIKTLDKWNTTLSSILEEQPDPKYFLSERMTKNLIMKSKLSDIQEAEDKKETFMMREE